MILCRLRGSRALYRYTGYCVVMFHGGFNHHTLSGVSPVSRASVEDSTRCVETCQENQLQMGKQAEIQISAWISSSFFAVPRSISRPTIQQAKVERETRDLNVMGKASTNSCEPDRFCSLAKSKKERDTDKLKQTKPEIWCHNSTLLSGQNPKAPCCQLSPKYGLP